MNFKLLILKRNRPAMTYSLIDLDCGDERRAVHHGCGSRRRGGEERSADRPRARRGTADLRTG
jgi:hypothetical protein